MESKSLAHRNSQYHDSKTKYLKYTVFHLNQDKIVLRMVNLAEFEQLSVPKYQKADGKGRFVVDAIGLDLQFVDIAESYSNGLPKEREWRKYWSKNSDDINVYNQGTGDSESLIVLRPLEIRSFRINFKQPIQIQRGGAAKSQEKAVHRKMRNRCF